MTISGTERLPETISYALRFGEGVVCDFGVSELFKSEKKYTVYAPVARGLDGVPYFRFLSEDRCKDLGVPAQDTDAVALRDKLAGAVSNAYKIDVKAVPLPVLTLGRIPPAIDYKTDPVPWTPFKTCKSLTFHRFGASRIALGVGMLNFDWSDAVLAVGIAELRWIYWFIGHPNGWTWSPDMKPISMESRLELAKAARTELEELGWMQTEDRWGMK